VRSGSIKGREFLGQLCDCQILNRGCAPWSELISWLVSYFVVRSLSNTEAGFGGLGKSIFRCRSSIDFISAWGLSFTIRQNFYFISVCFGAPSNVRESQFSLPGG
jgi:hypothetical protein